ncbi:MAG: GNAT family N-acetyltransferase [Pseudomonadota bacterium]
MIAIRDGRPDDGEGLKRVHQSSIFALARDHYSQAELDSWAVGLRPESYRTAMEGGEAFLVAESKGGELIAFCSTKGHEVMALYVHPDWVRLGIASDLLARAEARIAAEGHRRVQVRGSLSGQIFYESKGYQVVAREAWTTRGGLDLESLRLEKPLG